MAQAQSSVTLYGIADSSVLYTSKTQGANGQNAGRQFSFADSGSLPSQFGLTGTEDLGAGLKAKFTLESGIDMANGGLNNSNGDLFGRQAWVSIAAGFGEVRAGVQFSPFFLAMYDADPRSFSLRGQFKKAAQFG